MSERREISARVDYLGDGRPLLVVNDCEATVIHRFLSSGHPDDERCFLKVADAVNGIALVDSDTVPKRRSLDYGSFVGGVIATLVALSIGVML